MGNVASRVGSSAQWRGLLRPRRISILAVPLFKPKPTLSITSLTLTVEEARKLMFNDWIEECELIHGAFVEGLVALVPSLREAQP